MKMNEANQFSALGETAKGQAALQQGHLAAKGAADLAAAADGNYGKAKSIMGSLGGYAQEAAAAAYHAEFLLNPDMPPPPTPIV